MSAYYFAQNGWFIQVWKVSTIELYYEYGKYANMIAQQFNYQNPNKIFYRIFYPEVVAKFRETT